MTSLIFYYKETPFYLKTNNYFTVGYINSDEALIDITSNNDLTISVLESNTIVNRNAGDFNVLILNSNKVMESVYLKLSYFDSDTELTTTLYQSLALVQPFINITPQKLLQSYNQLLPSFYTRSLNTNQTNESRALMAQLYALFNNEAITTKVGTIDVPNAVFTDLETIKSNIFPSGGSTAWEQYLNGTNNLSNSIDYGSLLRLLYKVAINNDNNAYYFAKNISEYIYYRLGTKYYVLVDQHLNEYLGGFILDRNSLGECFLVQVSDEVNSLAFKIYILYAIDPDEIPQFTTAFQAELNLFIKKITPSALKVTIDYSTTLNQAIAEFGLTYLSHTYLGDPRQESTICISFDQYNLTETLGYGGSEGSIGYIQDFTLSISPSGTVEKVDSVITITVSANETYTLTVIPSYTVSPGNVILDNINNFTQFYSYDDNVEFIYTNSTTETVEVGSDTGTYTGRSYLGRVYNDIIWNIS